MIVSPEHLVERMAEISHATWLLQAVRDNGRTLADPASEGPPSYKKTDAWRTDCDEAERLLQAVRDEGASLNDLSTNPKHQVADHDKERAENTLIALQRLGVWRQDTHN